MDEVVPTMDEKLPKFLIVSIYMDLFWLFFSESTITKIVEN